MEQRQDKRPTNHLRLPSVTELVQTFKISDNHYLDPLQSGPSTNITIGTNLSKTDSPRSFATPDIANNYSPRGFSNYYYSRRYSTSNTSPSHVNYQYVKPILHPESGTSIEGETNPVMLSPLLADNKLTNDLRSHLESLLDTCQRSNQIENILRNLLTSLFTTTTTNVTDQPHNYLFNHNFQARQNEENTRNKILNIPESQLNILIKYYNQAIKTVNKIKYLRKSVDFLPSKVSPLESKKKRKQLPRRKSIHSISRNSVPTLNASKSKSGGKVHKLNFINSNEVSNSSIPSGLRGGLNEGLCIRNETKCEQCGSKATPEWRRGPNGSRTLCNACGLYYSKLIKKYNLKEADRIMKEKKEKGLVGDRRLS